MAGPRPLAVIPAAGGSTRMGCAKATLPWGPETLVRAHVRGLSQFADVVVVVGAEDFEVGSARKVRNPHGSDSAMLDSVRYGVGRHTGRVWIQPVDTVPAPASFLQQLAARSGAVVAVDRHGARGHPIQVTREMLDGLGPDETLRALSARATPLPGFDACAFNLNTRELYEAVRP